MQSRRDFLTTTGLGAAAVAAGLATDLAAPRPAVAAPGATKGTPGRVVLISDDRMTAKDRAVPEVTEKMLARAMQEFTGKKKPADAWASLFSAKDKIGIKISCLGKPCMSTTPELVNAILAALKGVGVPDEQILVMELFPSHMKMSRFKLQLDAKKGVRYVAHKSYGFADETTKVPTGKVKLAKALLEVDKVISLPVMKDHALSGVTCALKNMAFGSVHNPQSFHRNHCDPGIAEIYALPEIKDRTQLIICDGAFMQYDGGPQCKAAARVPMNSLYVTKDPVALDTLARDEIDTRRKAKRLPPLDKRSPTKHIATAASLGLGTDDHAKIKVTKVKV